MSEIHDADISPENCGKQKTGITPLREDPDRCAITRSRLRVQAKPAQAEKRKIPAGKDSRLRQAQENAKPNRVVHANSLKSSFTIMRVPAAAVVGIFEDTIARFAALAVLLPVVAGQSGNGRAQALAVTMRGLAPKAINGRHWFKVMFRETRVCAIAFESAMNSFVQPVAISQEPQEHR